MKTIWDPNCRQEILSRVEKLTPEQRPLWGRMTAAQMMAHAADPLRAAMGEMEVKPKPVPGMFRNPFMRYLIIYWIPWPKGAPTADEFVHTEDCDFQKNRAGLRSVVDQFATRGPNVDWKPHAAFGNLSGKDWGRLTYRHLDHHLRQFGV
jgi:hypothetical protein